jgi:Uma2 family endonuclease
VDEFYVIWPDLLVTAAPRARTEAEAGIPLLVVEVLSPFSEERDREEKVGLYLRVGVEEVWLVDPGRREIEIHTPRGAEGFAGARPAESRVLPGFRIVPDSLPEAGPGDPEPDPG